jgi:DNA mismatch repair protein MutL
MAIEVLSPLVAERIAAGEVIERPASAIKELLENAIDAHATSIEVRLEEGGKALLEVTDNGSGMTRDDLEICRLRHATSKIRTVSDLESLQTLGFRGEALPSLGAAGFLSILSRHESASTGPAYQVLPEGKSEEVVHGTFAGSPHGTRVRVEGLFSDIPARRKFLKSQAAEVSAVREWVERLALSHPEISWKLQSDERVILEFPSESEAARVERILGLETGQSLQSVSLLKPQSTRSPLRRVHAYWISGASRPTSKLVLQVLNGRALKDRLLHQAIVSSFKQSLLPGQFPAVAIFIEIDPSQVDFNVHPTKTEIRLLDSQLLFQTIYQGLTEALSNRFEGNSRPTTPSFDFPQNASLFVGPSPIPSTTSYSDSSSSSGSAAYGSAAWAQGVPRAARPNVQAPPTGTSKNPGLSLSNYVGNLFHTYLVFDLGQEMILIDQHAAHERVRFETLRAQTLRALPASSQQLLLPEVLQVPREARENTLAALTILGSLGFEAEDFGEDCVVIRSIPSAWGDRNLRTRLQDLMERIWLAVRDPSLPSSAKDLLLDPTLFERIAIESCRSSVRAGDTMPRESVMPLLDRLFHCEHPWNCPHGRPTLIQVPEGKIEEWFQRRAPRSALELER